MNKKYMFAFMFLFAGVLVSAGYLVSSFSFDVGVVEPFEVQYAVLGDAGDYNVAEDGTCADNLDWFSSDGESIPTGNMYPGESRKLCVKVSNAGESAIRYDVTSKILAGPENCSLAFPETTITGDAEGSSDTIGGLEFTVPADAPTVSGCEVGIEVTRG